MILPILNFILSPSKAPVTWLLLLLNLVVFALTSTQRAESEKSLNAYYRDQFFLNTQGALYAKHIHRHPSSYSNLVREKSNKALGGDRTSLQTLGIYALRDPLFLDSSTDDMNEGDEVAIGIWKKKIAELKNLQSAHPNTELGFIASHPSWTSALSYQFLHANWGHLIGNSVFFLLLGSYLEPIIGGAAFLLAFLTSGVFGAWLYMILGGATLTPMIGASGSVSGIVGLFGTMLWKRPVRFFYFIVPIEGFWGWVYLPAWIVLIHRVILDVTGYLSTVEDLGDPIAFTTHMGGLLTGVLLALFVFRRREATT